MSPTLTADAMASPAIVLHEWLESPASSGVVSVVRRGRVVIECSRGYANRDTKEFDVCHGGRTEDIASWVAHHLCAKSAAEEIEALESTTLDGLMAIEGAGAFLAPLGPERWAVVTSSSLLTAAPRLNASRLPVPRILKTI